MKRLNAVVRLIFALATMFALVFSSQAQSDDRHIITAQQKRSSAPAIHIVDQNGQPVVNGVPSGTGQIFDVAVGIDGFTFTPPTSNISAGDTVRWTWFSNGHSVTSGDACTANGQFCSPDDTNCDTGVLSNNGFVYEHTFAQAGTFNYFCSAHCTLGMTGVVNVATGPTPTPNPTPTPTSSPSPTATATPTAIPSATPSVTPPPPTATPTATATVSPTPIGRPRPTPRARPTPHARP
jgi:plastocyanin